MYDTRRTYSCTREVGFAGAHKLEPMTVWYALLLLLWWDDARAIGGDAGGSFCQTKKPRVIAKTATLLHARDKTSDEVAGLLHVQEPARQ